MSPFFTKFHLKRIVATVDCSGQFDLLRFPLISKKNQSVKAGVGSRKNDTGWLRVNVFGNQEKRTNLVEENVVKSVLWVDGILMIIVYVVHNFPGLQNCELPTRLK